MKHVKSGFVLGAAILVMLLMLSGLLLGIVSTEISRQINQQPIAQQHYLNTIRTRMAAWYEHHAADLAASSEAIDLTNMTSKLSMENRWNIQFISSVRQQTNNIAYHVLIAWLPIDNQVPIQFDQKNAKILNSPEMPYILFSGQTIQQKHYDRTVANLSHIARLLQTHFRTMTYLDPNNTHDLNYFRTSDCHRPEPRYIPCIDTYTPMTHELMNHIAGLDPSNLLNAWGKPIEISNLENASTTYPYSVSIRTQTPWDSDIRITATQPDT